MSPGGAASPEGRGRAVVIALVASLLVMGGCSGGDGAAIDAGQPLTTASVAAAPVTSETYLTLPSPAEGGVGETSLVPDPSSSAPAESSTSVTGAPTAAGAEPNCAASCNIVMEGDSLTLGLGDWLCLQVETGSCVNSGIGGNRADQMIETARSDVDLYASDDGGDVLILWAGTNDLWQQHHSTDPTANADATYGFMTDYIAERRANGWDYNFVMTNPPANPSVIQGSDHLNELIRANTAGADQVIDVAAESRLADPFDSFLRAPDGVHYKDPGREIIVYDYLVPAIKALDGA
jgi:hypothetical protein